MNGEPLLMDTNKLWNWGGSVTFRKCGAKPGLFTLRFPEVSCPQPGRAAGVTGLQTVPAVIAGSHRHARAG